MHWIGSLPLLIILWGIYNGLVLSGQAQEALGSLLFRLALPSQATWSVTLSDLLLFAGVVLLAVEIFRATSSGAASILNHALSTLVFVLFLVEFLIVPQAGNSVFFALTLMALTDVVAGFSVTIVAARRDVDLDR